jgi:hypothetical protein
MLVLTVLLHGGENCCGTTWIGGAWEHSVEEDILIYEVGYHRPHEKIS